MNKPTMYDLLEERAIVRSASGAVFHADGSELNEDDWNAIQSLQPECDSISAVASYASLGEEA